MTNRPLNDITGVIIDSAMKIHISLGPGLLESAYEAVLARKLELAGLRVARQKAVTFTYEDVVVERAFCVDLLVEDAVVVELKSVEHLTRVHSKQLLTYLRLMDLRVGLLINFGAAMLKDGLHRVVNQLPPEEAL